MKQTYRRSDIFRVSQRTIVITAGIGVLGAVVLLSPARALVTRGIERVAPGVWGAGSSAGVSVRTFFDSFRAKESLVKENDTLREELALLKAHVLDRNLLEERIVELEEILGRARSDDRIMARVLATPGRSPYGVLVIDIGEDYGIGEGDRVMYGESVIGEIADIYAYSSKVRLFSSPGEELEVRIGTTVIPAVAKGRGMGNFEARVPRQSAIFLKDDVITPEGYLLGTVGAVIEDEGMPFVQVLIATPFNIAQIRTVEVVK